MVRAVIAVGTVFCGRDPTRFVWNLARMDRSGLSFIWIDTTSSPEFYRVLGNLSGRLGLGAEIHKHPVPVYRIPGLPGWLTPSSPSVHAEKGAAIAASYEALREHFLRGREDFLLVVEDDVFPPPDAPVRLLADYRAGGPGVAAVAAAVPMHGDAKPIAWNIKMRPGVAEFVDVEDRGWGVREVGAASFGCILIPRWVLERVAFRFGPGSMLHQDLAFALDARRAGWRILLDYGVRCGHEDLAELWT
jgi:hypothetical protein